MSGSWHLITGEYPPQRGGVSDYTATLARALADAGCSVHVWTPSGAESSTAGVTVHQLPDVFGALGLRVLDAGLDAVPAPRVVLVQYVPQAFGARGMNVSFCRWVERRGRTPGDDLRVMFHEPYYPFVAWPPHRNLLALANRFMATLLMAAARTAYVSTTAWAGRLRRYAPASLSFVWLPVPSSIPALRDTGAVVAMRRLLAPDASTRVVGHFGTYGTLNTALLVPALRALLARRADVRICLLGTGSDAMAAELVARDPSHRGRIIGTGHQAPAELAACLQACDVALQPYTDGASGRRTTLMAALANGVAVVGNRGPATEAVWAEDDAVVLVPRATPGELADAVAALLDDDTKRTLTASRGRALYDRCFSIEHTVKVLLAPTGSRT